MDGPFKDGTIKTEPILKTSKKDEWSTVSKAADKSRKIKKYSK